MTPDLHLAPDAVRGLARTAGRTADDLDTACALPEPDGDTVDELVHAVRRASAEIAAFAHAAEAAVRRVRHADRSVAAMLNHSTRT